MLINVDPVGHDNAEEHQVVDVHQHVAEQSEAQKH